MGGMGLDRGDAIVVDIVHGSSLPTVEYVLMISLRFLSRFQIFSKYGVPVYFLRPSPLEVPLLGL